MDKVYCKDCSWWKYGSCEVVLEVNEYTGKRTFNYASNSNANGECKYHKRKWWKFWVSRRK